MPCTRLYLLHYKHNSISKHAKTTKEAKLGRYIRMASIFWLIEHNPLISYLIWDNLFYELRQIKIVQINFEQYIKMCKWIINISKHQIKLWYSLILWIRFQLLCSDLTSFLKRFYFNFRNEMHQNCTTENKPQWILKDFAFFEFFAKDILMYFLWLFNVLWNVWKMFHQYNACVIHNLIPRLTKFLN